MTAEVPAMSIGMGAEAAYENGFHHGKQGKVTPWICFLTRGTEERRYWMKGYKDGERESDKPPFEGSGPADWE